MLTVLVKTRPDLRWTRGLQLAWEQRVRRGYAGVVDPALSDPDLDVRYYALAIAEKVKARPRPYSWVKD